MADRYDEDQRMDTAAIRADIRDTRERMSHTLDELGGRLNTNVLKQQARDTFEEQKQQVKQNLREATIGRAEHMARNAAGRVTDTRRGIVDTIRENPIPAAMVGIGLGWLFYNGRRDELAPTATRDMREMGYWTGADHGFREQATSQETDRIQQAAEWGSEATSTVRDRAAELTGHAQETVSDFAGRTREATSALVDRTTGVLGDTAGRVRNRAGNLASTTRQQAHRLEDRFHDAVIESPLVVGAAAVALGLTAGLALPSTRRESELMGAHRDQLVGQARGMVEETSGRVQQVAQRVMEEAQSTVQEVVQETRSTVQEAAEELKTTAREAAQEQGLMGGSGTRTDGFDTATSRTAGAGTTGTGSSGSGYSTTGTSGAGMSGSGMSGAGTSGSGMSGSGGSTAATSGASGGLNAAAGSTSPTGPERGSIADPRES